MSAIVFYLDGYGQKRWRVRAPGNHEIIGAATEGYHNLTEAAENLVQLVQEVVSETYGFGASEDPDAMVFQENTLTNIRNHVMNIAARGTPETKAQRQARLIKEASAGVRVDNPSETGSG